MVRRHVLDLRNRDDFAGALIFCRALRESSSVLHLWPLCRFGIPKHDSYFAAGWNWPADDVSLPGNRNTRLDHLHCVVFLLRPNTPH